MPRSHREAHSNYVSIPIILVGHSLGGIVLKNVSSTALKSIEVLFLTLTCACLRCVFYRHVSAFQAGKR